MPYSEASFTRLLDMSLPLLKDTNDAKELAQLGKGRILLLAPQPFFLNRGTPINVRAMATSLGRAGYEVDLLAYPIGDDLSIPGVHLHRCAGIPFIKKIPIGPSIYKIPLDIMMFFSALRLLRKREYAVIHGIEEGGILACVLSRLFTVPFVYDMDSCMREQLEQAGLLPFRFMSKLFAALESYCMKQASSILTVCRALSRKS